MEGKKTIIAMIVIIVLILALIGVTFLFNNFEKEQLQLLTQESNKLLQQDLSTETIDMEIKTSDDYAKVEKSIKEYLSKIQNIYLKMNNLSDEIDLDNIFSAQNIEEKNLDKIDNIIDDYRQKSKDYLEEYINMTKEENIMENINSINILKRKSYYVDLYKTVMLSDTMKNQYSNMQDSVEAKKDDLYDKLNVISKIKQYLDEHSKYWSIKDDKITFTNTNTMVEYYNLRNQFSK